MNEVILYDANDVSVSDESYKAEHRNSGEGVDVKIWRKVLENLVAAQ